MKTLMTTLFLILSLTTTPISAAKFYNCLEHLDDRIENSKVLNLHTCNLEDKNIPTIVNFLEQHKEITDLILSDNYIRSIGAERIAKIPTIKMLDISMNFIGDEGAALLSKNTSIETLSAYINDITDNGIIALSKNKNIRTLMLADDFSSTGLVALAKNTTLECLYLQTDKTVFDYPVLNAFSQNKTITGLILPDAHFGSWVAEFFTKMSALTNLYLLGSDMDDEAIDVLSKNTSLAGLALGGDITDKGIKILANMSNLKDLRLEGLKLTEHLGTILSANESIRNLELLNDNLHDEDAFSLSTMTLALLDVRWNHIGPNGIAALKNSKTIKKLLVDYQDEKRVATQQSSYKNFYLDGVCNIIR